jgi:Flp pilus assembly protein TadB
MILDAYVGVLAALAAGGVALIVAGVRGRSASQSGAARLPGWLRQWWRGTDRSPAGRRRRHVLLVAAAGAGGAAYLLTWVPAVGLLVAMAVPGIPWLWSAGREEEQAIGRAEALTEWTRRLKDQLSTGAGLVAAITAAAGAAPTAIASEVGALAARLRSGTDPRQALHLLAHELDDPVADQVVAALLLHLQDRGQHLTEVLTAIAADAGSQVTMRREVHARRTQPRNTVRFMTVFGLVIALVVVRGELMLAYATPAGQVVLVVLAGGFVATLAWVRAMSRPPSQPRILGRARAA